VKADPMKPAGERADDYRGMIDRKLNVPDSSPFKQRAFLEGIRYFNHMAARKGEELLKIHPAFDLENQDQDERLEVIWHHLMSHYFEVMSPWVKELYRDLDEYERRFLDKEIADKGVPLERMDEGALLCLRTSFLLMNSDILKRCGADPACIVFEALKSVEIAGKRMLEKPFSERKDQLRDKAREICASKDCCSKLDWHLQHLEPLDKRYVSFGQLLKTLDNVSCYCDCNRVIHGTRHLGIVLVVFGRKYQLLWNDPTSSRKAVLYMENPLNLSYDDERRFIELCSDMCVAQAARNRYIHSTLGFMAKPQQNEARQGEVSELARLAVDMLCGLHELAFN